MRNRLLVMSILSSALVLALAACAQKAPQQTGQAGAQEPAKMPMAGEKGMPMQHGMAMPTTTGSLHVLSPKNGAVVRTTDIPVRVAVSDFALSRKDVGRPDRDGEGHIHVMVDGMNMGVLFNFYTSPRFTLPGRGLAPGEHTLIFDLASNTHEDFGNTVRKVTINYRPHKAEALPRPVSGASAPAVKIVSPADGATVPAKFTVRTQTPGFRPETSLEGKPNLAGYGHLHVFVDMNMKAMEMPGGMMSMAGMVGMPGSNSFPVDLTGWPAGPHTITVMAVQDDHTPIPGAMPATIHINVR